MYRKYNIQPWRKLNRHKQKKNFFITCFGIVGFILLLAFALNYYLQDKATNQRRAIQYLTSEYSKAQNAKKEINQIKKTNDDIELQIKTFEDLREQKVVVAKVLDFIAGEMPKNVFLESVSYMNNQIVFIGVAESEGGVSSLIRNLGNNNIFSNISLTYIKDAENTGRYTVRDNAGTKIFEIHAMVSDSNSSQQGQGGKK